MKSTITKADLQATVDRINRITGSPLEPYTRQTMPTGRVFHSANIGNYHLSGAYGGYALHRMDTDGGGITDVLRVGHVSKRELYNLMHAFIRGLEFMLIKASGSLLAQTLKQPPNQ